MKFEEFLEPRNKTNLETTDAEPVVEKPTDVSQESPEEGIETTEELDVQRAVVEELAADKAALDDEISKKTRVIENLKGDLEKAKVEISRLQGEVVRLTTEIAKAKDAISGAHAETARVQNELAVEKEKQFDMQERNPNALALLDREIELPDRFPGETRDQVLEALKEARDRAEADGRCRRAQILESVLVANEPNGSLERKREELKKLFAENGNIINGTVIEELKKLGLSHKKGEEYLLIDEILKRAY